MGGGGLGVGGVDRVHVSSTNTPWDFVNIKYHSVSLGESCRVEECFTSIATNLAI